MSRTFRRKNYEQTEAYRCRAGYKIGGVYCQSEYLSWRREEEEMKYGIYRFYAPTRKEHFDEYYKIHGDGKYSSKFRPNKYWRKVCVRQLRHQAHTEISAYLKNPEMDFYGIYDYMRTWWD